MRKTLEELEKISLEKELEAKRIKLSIKLNLCPVCGADIIDEDLEIYDTPKKYFFGLIQSKSKIWDTRQVCSANKEHYEDKCNFMSHHY